MCFMRLDCWKPAQELLHATNLHFTDLCARLQLAPIDEQTEALLTKNLFQGEGGGSALFMNCKGRMLSALPSFFAAFNTTGSSMHGTFQVAACTALSQCSASMPRHRKAVADIAGPEALESFYLNSGGVPATSATAPLPPAVEPASSKPVVLFRDTNAWCPYCQKVWVALLEKGIPFDSVLIDLRNKPEWYGDVIESKQTPAARINGELVGESDDIMLV